MDSLLSNGARVSTDRVRVLLRDGRLLLLLDAFDEALESCVLEAERDIRSLLADCSASRIVITTGPFRLPRLNSVRRYELEIISNESGGIARMHPDSYCIPFLVNQHVGDRPECLDTSPDPTDLLYKREEDYHAAEAK